MTKPRGRYLSRQHMIGGEGPCELGCGRRATHAVAGVAVCREHLRLTVAIRRDAKHAGTIGAQRRRPAAHYRGARRTR